MKPEGTGNVHSPVDEAAFRQAVHFAAAVPAQQLGELRLAQSLVLGQGFQRFLGRRFQPLQFGVGNGQGQDLGMHLGFETRGEEQGHGVKEGAEIVPANPLGQGEGVGVEQGSGLHRLQDILGKLHLGRRGQLDDDALEDAAAKGNPDQLTRLDPKAVGDAVGKGAGVVNRGVHRYFCVSHHSRWLPGGVESSRVVRKAELLSQNYTEPYNAKGFPFRRTVFIWFAPGLNDRAAAEAEGAP